MGPATRSVRMTVPCGGVVYAGAVYVRYGYVRGGQGGTGRYTWEEGVQYRTTSFNN